MPPVFNLNDVVEVTMEGTYQGSKILNVWHYKVIETPLNQDYEAALLAMLPAWISKVWTAANGIKGRVVQTYNLGRVRAQTIHPIRQPYIDEAVGEAGGVNEIGCPSNTAMVQAIRPDLVGKGKTGSKHMTALPQSVIEGAFWEAGAVAEMGTALDLALTNLTTIAPAVTYRPVLWDRTNSTANNILNSIMSDEVRIMRRRTVHVGI